jgi:hypothetical protein
VPASALAAAAAQPTPQAQAVAAATAVDRSTQQQQQQLQQGAAQRPGGQQQVTGMNLGPLSFGTGGIGFNRGASGGQATPITWGTGQPISMSNLLGFGR